LKWYVHWNFLLFKNREHSFCCNYLRKKLKEHNNEVKLVEIEAVKKPGFLKAGYSAFRQKELPMKNTGFDVHEFDMILVGCPVWAGRPAPFIKTFFQKAFNGR
jgi:hypothetical protein